MFLQGQDYESAETKCALKKDECQKQAQGDKAYFLIERRLNLAQCHCRPAPIIIILLLLGALILFTETSSVSPLVYTLF